MSHTFDEYAELAQQHLYGIVDDDADANRAHGQAWATLALAAAIHELAEAQQNT